MKAAKTIGAVLLFTPGSLIFILALWSYFPGVVIGMGLAALVWVGVELLR